MIEKHRIVMMGLAVVAAGLVVLYLIPNQKEMDREMEPLEQGRSATEDMTQAVAPQDVVPEGMMRTTSGSLVPKRIHKKEVSGELNEAIQTLQDGFLSDSSDQKYMRAMELASSKDKEQRKAALQELRQIGGKDAIRGSIAMLKDANEEIANEAMDALRFSLVTAEDYAELLPLLEDVLKEWDDRNDVEGIMMTLTALGGLQVMPTFASLLEYAQEEGHRELESMVTDYISQVTGTIDDIRTPERAYAWIRDKEAEIAAKPAEPEPVIVKEEEDDGRPKFITTRQGRR